MDMYKKLEEGEMLIRSQPTTLLEVYCQFMLNSKDIVRSIIGPDSTIQTLYMDILDPPLNNWFQPHM